MSCSPLFLTIVDEIDILMQDFSHTREKIVERYKWRFDNQMRFDIYEHKGKNTLRLGRGAWLVRTYPILYDRFDEVMKVLARVEIKNTQQLHDKHILGILKLINEAPSGIGAFD